MAPAVFVSLFTEPLECAELIVLGGEALHYSDTLKMTIGGRTQVVNAYGPTEVCIDASHFLIKLHGEVRKYVPLGRPLSNKKIYKGTQYICLQVKDELLVKGIGLSRGYLNQGSQTGEKFIPATHYEN